MGIDAKFELPLKEMIKMKTLFDILDAIIESGYTQKILSDPEHVSVFADEAGLPVDSEQAESIIRVANYCLEQQENGAGEWVRMRDEAKANLTCYMHAHSGGVATVEMWKGDFESMDAESWFGKPADECKELHWLDDVGLDEVEWDIESREWVEV